MRVVIYKMPLIERAMGGVSAVGLTIIPIACLCLGYDNKFEMIALLIAMLLYSFLMYLNIFKTYICLDLDNEKLIIRNGLKKDELTTTNLIDLQVEEDREYSGLFSLNINFVGYTKKDFSWSSGFSARVLFGSVRSQRERLEKFCKECNGYLNYK